MTRDLLQSVNSCEPGSLRPGAAQRARFTPAYHTEVVMALSSPLKAAVIGYGRAFDMGKHHADAINGTEGLTVAGVCDVDEQRRLQAQKDFPGIETYATAAQVAADDGIDLAVVVTPHNAHTECALPCLEAGKNVVVEKPMALTTDECTRMIEAARKADVTLSVFHNRRKDGDFMAIQDVVRQGRIGDIFHVEIHGGQYERPRQWWRSQKEVSGGLFYDWGAHYIDWLLQLVPGPMATVSGQFQKRVWDHVTNEDHVEAYIKFRNGVAAHVQFSSIAALPKLRWYILGTKGAIESTQQGHLNVYTSVNDHVARSEVQHRESEWYAYYQELAAHLLEGKPNPVTPESARRVIAVMELAERSSRTGREQQVPYETDVPDADSQ